MDPVAVRNFLALKKKSYAVKFDLDGTGYSPVENIGAGAYGVVCSAVQKKTNKKVAIKKIPNILEQSTIAKRTYREIKILKHFKHDNIIAIQEILHPGDDLAQFKDVYIVFDLMESDLHRIIHSSQDITEEHVRFFTYQIMRGLKYVHSANVAHRDLKPSNLLVNENCDLKIGDFGMARGISTNMDEYSMVMTQYVATRWYRAPELMILPKETYTEAVDMWSVGCILAELIGRRQLFPGRSHTDQIEKIIDKLGTPSNEYLTLTSSDVIRAIILKKGHVKPASWTDVYPKASKKTLDLLAKMLVLDPRIRITVHQALKHPFLNKYHDPEDEPICIPIFNFDFERKDMGTPELKKAILTEIMEYHKPKPKPRLQFDFRPVSKDELNQPKATTKFSFKPVPKSELEDNKNIVKVMHSKASSGAKTVELIRESKQFAPHELDLSRQSQTLTDSSNSDNSFERKHSELVKQLHDFQALQEASYTDPQNVINFQPIKSGSTKVDDSSLFKKPEGLPLIVKVKDTNKTTESLMKSGNDIEMLSAKSTGKTDSGFGLTVFTKPSEASDIEMASAQSTGRDKSKEALPQTVPEHPQETKPLDTKELIRMALLSNERRKQREEIPSKPKAVTALQRQKEREEKRRLKLEKAKHKKKKEKEKQSPLELTDDDKKLLAKWKNMQKVPGATAAPQKPDKVVPVTAQREGSPATIIQDSLLQSLANTTQPIPSSLQQAIPSSLQHGIGTLPSEVQALKVSAAHQGQTQGQQDAMMGQHNFINLVPGGSILTGQMPVVETASKTPIIRGAGARSTLDVGENVNTPVISSTENVLLPHTGTSTNSQVFDHSFSNIVVSQPSEPQVSNDEHIIGLSNATAPFNSYSNWTDSVTHKVTEPVYVEEVPAGLPSYPEALAQKTLHEIGWMEAAQNSTNPLPPETRSGQGHDMSQIPQMTSIQSHGMSQIPDTQWLLPNFTADKTVIEPKPTSKADNDMKIITKQLKQSIVEDLTLTHTPKGTGGGYGVASDFDLFMESAGHDKPDSALVSPSLYHDWQELTGNLDPREFESVLQEYMTSPSSSQEFNSVMLSLMSPKSSKVS